MALDPCCILCFPAFTSHGSHSNVNPIRKIDEKKNKHKKLIRESERRKGKKEKWTTYLLHSGCGDFGLWRERERGRREMLKKWVLVVQLFCILSWYLKFTNGATNETDGEYYSASSCFWLIILILPTTAVLWYRFSWSSVYGFPSFL